MLCGEWAKYICNNYRNGYGPKWQVTREYACMVTHDVLGAVTIRGFAEQIRKKIASYFWL